MSIGSTLSIDDMSLKRTTVAYSAVVLALALAFMLSNAILLGKDTQNSGSAMKAAGDMAPPPDPEAVIAQELENAIGRGSNAALINFIARHGTHALAVEARKRLDARNLAEPASQSAGPDAAIYEAFDDARTQNTTRAYQWFLHSYPNHPLALEARRRMSSLP